MGLLAWGLWNMRVHRPNGTWATERIGSAKSLAHDYPVIEMWVWVEMRAWVVSIVHRTRIIASSAKMAAFAEQVNTSLRAAHSVPRRRNRIFSSKL